MANKRPSILVIPDVHCHPDYDNLRLRAAGNFAADLRPDFIISLGDFADLPSLAKQEKGRRSFEGRRYKKDVEATIDGLEEFTKPIRRAIKNGRSKHATWTPDCYITLGNHEWRIDRTTNELAELAGAISTADLRYSSYGFKPIDFLQPLIIAGIAFAHYFVSGVMGRPISGEHIGRTLCSKLHASAVAGHSHLLDHAERAHISGTKIFGLSAGCFVHRDYKEDWNKATRAMWWNGLVVLEDLDGEGYYDRLVMVNQRKLMRDYL